MRTMSKSKAENIFIVIADHMLETTDMTKDWSKQTGLRRCWYWLCGLFFGQIGISFVFRTMLKSFAAHSTALTFVYRLIIAAVFLFIAVLTITFAFEYAKFVTTRRNRLHFLAVLFFYALSILSFGKLYYFIYFMWPNTFVYPGAPLVPSPLLDDLGFAHWHMTTEFILFSAFQSVNGSYPNIRPESMGVSVLLYVQSLFTLMLIAVLIAGYVNQRFDYVPEVEGESKRTPDAEPPSAGDAATRAAPEK